MNELIVEDLNAHQLWDKNIEDDRGNEIAESILEGVTALQLTWEWNNADWTSFRDSLDERIKEVLRKISQRWNDA